MTTQKKALISAALIVWIILLLQIAATLWHLYWIFPWFDMVMHFLGGAWLALMIFTVLSSKIDYVRHHWIVLFLVLIGGAMFFGFIWEIMEFFIDLVLKTNFFQPDLPDTMSDMAFDTIGALVAYIFIRLSLIRHYGK